MLRACKVGGQKLWSVLVQQATLENEGAALRLVQRASGAFSSRIVREKHKTSARGSRFIVQIFFADTGAPLQEGQVRLLLAREELGTYGLKER